MKTCLEDEPTLSESGGVRYLHFGSPWVQGAMQVRKPERLCLAYTQQMMAWWLFFQPEPDQVITQLGLGAGSLTRFCHKFLPNPLVIVERNPSVLTVCQQYFRLPGDERVQVVIADAGQWVLQSDSRGSASVLMVDLYDSQAQGPVCDSLAFYRHCHQVLASNGVLSVNLFGQHASYDRNIDRLDRVFGGRLLLLPPAEQGNQVVLAFKGDPLEWSRESLMARADDIQTRTGLSARRWVRSLGKLTGI